MRQGSVSEEKRQRIIDLLRNTDLDAPTLAARFGLSRSTIMKIMKESGVRQYGGNHLSWTTDDGRAVDTRIR